MGLEEKCSNIDGCCTSCNGVGSSIADSGKCWDCQGTGHPHEQKETIGLEESINWMNDHPDEAIKRLPEVVRYIRWQSRPFVMHSNGEPKYDRTPRKFTTKLGKEVS